MSKEIPEKYDLGIGIQKTLKNVAVTMGIPGVALFGESFIGFIPENYKPYVFVVLSLVAYLLKNYLQVKKEIKTAKIKK